MENVRLKIFRIQNRLTQNEISNRIGVNRQYYGSVERGQINGSVRFWRQLQTAFDLSGSDIWDLMNSENEKKGGE